jgi:hypothetical protein
MDLYLLSSHTSCDNITSLASKHINENNTRLNNLFSIDNCSKLNTPYTDTLLDSQSINNKHCHYIRHKYPMQWWDNIHSLSLLSSSVPSDMIIQTRNRHLSSYNDNTFNCIPLYTPNLGKYAAFSQDCSISNGLIDRYNNNLIS